MVTSNRKVVFGLDAGSFFNNVFDHAQAKTDKAGGNGCGKGKLKPNPDCGKKHALQKTAKGNGTDQACGGYGKDALQEDGAQNKKHQNDRHHGNADHDVGIDQNPFSAKVGDLGTVAKIVGGIDEGFGNVGKPIDQKSERSKQ